MNVGPPSIPLIKSKYDEKSDKYSVEIKLHRDPTPKNSDLYEFKMAHVNVQNSKICWELIHEHR